MVNKKYIHTKEYIPIKRSGKGVLVIRNAYTQIKLKKLCWNLTLQEAEAPILLKQVDTRFLKNQASIAWYKS